MKKKPKNYNLKYIFTKQSYSHHLGHFKGLIISISVVLISHLFFYEKQQPPWFNTVYFI